jgi:hypothetical protein
MLHGEASLVVAESAVSLSSAVLYQALLHRVIHANKSATGGCWLLQGQAYTKKGSLFLPLVHDVSLSIFLRLHVFTILFFTRVV